MCLGKNLDDNGVIKFNNLTIESSKDVEIWSIKIEKNLHFNNDKKLIFRKASQKSSALLRIFSNFDVKQKILI